MMKKVIYSEYEGKYDESIKERLEKDPGSVDVEMMRANLYGYTYTKEYADGDIKQSVRNGIDCLELKNYDGRIEKVYFDISRRFEVG